VIKMWLDKLTKSISSINYYNNKAKHIFELSKMLDKDPNLLCPDLEKLQKLPWVWIKTAKVISYVLFWSKVIAVDTHVHRVSNRLWLVKTQTPEKTSLELEKVVPDKYKETAHHTLILFGRYHCTARNPKCNECPFTKICKYTKSL
jgi:endonuclease-3